MNKPTLTIGIAAYNEAQNIGALIRAFLNQVTISFQLMEIIVVSDASTDATDNIAKSFRGYNVRLVRLNRRSGVCAVQNTLMSLAHSDILVVSDADILPGDSYHLENLIAPILADSSVGLTSAKLVPARPRTFIEKVLVRNHKFKVCLFEKIASGHNIYNCAGPSRAFARFFYKRLRYPDNIPNDAYSFLSCRALGLKFKYAPRARAIFRRPSILKDHVKQGVRFIAGQHTITRMFGKVAMESYEIPKSKLWRLICLELITHPVLFISYAGMLILTKLKARHSQFNARWEIAVTSKRI